MRKLIARWLRWLLPYWCRYCKKSFRKVVKYREHTDSCKVRAAFYDNVDRNLQVPVNRAQKRRMAKEAGQIKDWAKLNAP